VRSIDVLRATALALLAAGACAGCSPSDPFTPSGSPIVQTGRLMAVTLPEIRIAGQSIPIEVHWVPRDCGEHFREFITRSDTSGDVAIEIRVERPSLAYGCPDDGFCQASTNAQWVVVPASGSRRVTVIGDRDTIQIDVAPNLSASGQGHIVDLVSRADGTPVAGAQVFYGRIDGWPADTLGMTMTNASGEAVATPACPGDSLQSVLMSVEDDRSPYCYLSRIQFAGSFALCGRAWRTVLLYGQPASAPASPGAAVGSPSTAAMYSAGRPWWRKPATIAFR